MRVPASSVTTDTVLGQRVRFLSIGATECQFDDLANNRAELAQQRAPVIRNAVAFADLLHLGAISAYRRAGMSGNRWCSIWWDRLPDSRWKVLPPVRLAEPSTWRKYHCPETRSGFLRR